MSQDVSAVTVSATVQLTAQKFIFPKGMQDFYLEGPNTKYYLLKKAKDQKKGEAAFD